jgi:hypothetical protein
MPKQSDKCSYTGMHKTVGKALQGVISAQRLLWDGNAGSQVQGWAGIFQAHLQPVLGSRKVIVLRKCIYILLSVKDLVRFSKYSGMMLFTSVQVEYSTCLNF